MTTCVLDQPRNARAPHAEHTWSSRRYRPSVDILETADELTVFVDMPGVKADDVDINFDNGKLTVHGMVKNRGREGVTSRRAEYGVGDFHRTFQVSEKFDSAKITAELAHGVLTLHLPKSEAIKPRRITLAAKEQ